MQISKMVVDFFSILTLGGQFLIIVLMFSLFFQKKIRTLVSEHYVLLVLIVSGISTFGSLVFSLLLGFAPCELCWYQRIFMYPVAVISFMALLANEKKIGRYVMPLSIIGGLIATYHVFLQIFPTILKCTDEVAKCSTRQFAFLGYITIPVMALTAFILLILFTLIYWKETSPKKK